jgi:hypothetical protein
MTSSNCTESVRLGSLRADPQLSKFQPLERILLYDHFDCGLSGWTEVLGDYEGRLETVTQYPELMDSRPPMLSTATMHDSGSAGAFSGTYSMKVATRPKESHVAKALRRLTFRQKSRLQCELYFTFKPEASEIKLSELDLRAFGVSYDLQDDRRREWPAVRFLNAQGKSRIERWQYHAGGTRAPHLDGWKEVPKGHQELCYNETATKQNWHYLRWLIDLSGSRYLELQCNDRSWDLSGTSIPTVSKNPNLRTLMNLGFFVEANADKRCFLYIDSVLLSTGG